LQHSAQDSDFRAAGGCSDVSPDVKRPGWTSAGSRIRVCRERRLRRVPSSAGGTRGVGAAGSAWLQQAKRWSAALLLGGVTAAGAQYRALVRPKWECARRVLA